MAFALALSAACASPAKAETETVDGVEWSYRITGGKAEVTGANPVEGDLTIPLSLGSYTVTSIANSAFYGCSGLTSVTIANSVTSLGSFAFYGCRGLKHVTIPDGVTGIGYGAFWNCVGLKSVSIPNSVTNIGQYVFRGCNSLTNCEVGPHNPAYSSLDGVIFSCDKSRLILFPSGKQGSYAIPAGVTDIAKSAFCACRKLTSVTIPNSVTRIGSSAFADCNRLVSVMIDEGLTSIEYDAFRGCISLESMTIPNSVTQIGYCAFDGCRGMTTVSIGSGVTNIAYSAFYGCKGLREFNVAEENTVYTSWDGLLFSKDMAVLVGCPVGKIGTCTIPASVKRIATNVHDFAFAGCTRLTAFEVAVGNATYTSRDGVLFSNDMKTLVCCPGGKSGAYSIPDGVTSIDPYAFSWCGKITSVFAPSTLESIGEYSFYFCNRIETLFLPLSWQGKSLGTARIRPGCRIIYGMPSTESVAGVTWLFFIQDGAATVLAADGSGKVAIPAQLGGCAVTSIAPSAFFGCEGFTCVDIPSCVTDIGSHAFFGCKGLTNVIIPAGVSNISDHAFSGCVGLGTMEIPSVISEIGDYAFSGCIRLTNIVIPDTVKSIGAHAFHDCIRLANLTLGNGVEDIGKYAFAKCSGLTSVVIPDNVSNIGDYAFYRCTGLGDLVVRDGVERIGSFAFADCDGLATVTIPASVTELGDHPFAMCDGLTEIAVDSGNGFFASQEGVLFSKDGTALLGVPAGMEGVFVLPDSVEDLGVRAFAGCVGLTALEAGEGNVHFASRDGVLFSKDMTRLLVCPAGKAGAFAVPDGVVRIEDGAFDDCPNLTRIMIPNSVESLGTNSLSRCDGLVALFVPEAWEDVREGDRTLNGARIQADWEIIHGTLEPEVVDGVEWHFFAEDGGAVLLPGDYGADVMIPAVLGGRPVTRIGKYAFYGCEELEKVEIPGSVTDIGEYAFYGCEGLESVSLPESVRNIGKWAFGRCKGLKNVELPEGIESIGDRAFFECSGLPEAAVPDSVERIGVNAFFGNSELTVLEVGTNNANYASRDGVLFSKDMEKLLWCPDGKTGEYAIPGTVKTIATRAFGDCVGLTAGTMPESVEKIGRNSFYGCRGLAVLYVPASWEGVPGWLDMLARAKLPPECQIIYLKDDPAETTSTTPVPVPFAWLEEKAEPILSAHGWDYEAAAATTASNGLAVWECYLAGLVPTDEGAAFKVKSFSFVDGQPVVKWDPDLNEDGTTDRVYRVWARKSVETPEPEGENATNGWTDVTGEEASWVTNGWRFFRVDVEMPK